MDYLIDTNSLIDAHKKWYRPGVFKSVWDFLASNDHVKMTTLVYREINYPDGLVAWTQATFKQNQIQVSSEIIVAYDEIMDWLSNSERWSPAGISEWQKADKADPWLIATAKVSHQTIVTMDGNGRATLLDVSSFSGKEPKINAVADQFKVQTITLYELLDKLNLSL